MPQLSSPNLVFNSSLGVAGPSLPFSYTAQDTYWFDGTWTGNTYNTVGDDTVAVVPDRVSNKSQSENLRIRMEYIEACAAWRLPNGQFTDKPPRK